ncbi:HutD family protein [Glutamicibacter sp. MNS18]|uniref:HutD family protein n=1 Tax=Glutamicibacter sp. MNS18 TaxID=2989817 RepID=UPI002235C9C7|nr:HutD family protein [Glutamicibacter sp. MNS18]MCW4465856.1 HutD family protein [Glutamicibacter sp. MNS18]
MSEKSTAFLPGSVHELAASPKQQWELGQVRQIAAGRLTPEGALTATGTTETHWQLSIRSVEKPGRFDTGGLRHILTLIAGDFLQLVIDGAAQGVEPLRPAALDSSSPIETSQPTEELLLLHLAHDPQQVRSTVRIVELSRKREQYLFDGQLGVLLQGQATVVSHNQEAEANPRDTVVGGDAAEVRLSGRGVLAVISVDHPGS